MKINKLFVGLVSFLMFCIPTGFAQEKVNVVVTVVLASNEGNDFNMDNDAYKDKLIELFSYSYYEQKNQYKLVLSQGTREKLTLDGGYDLLLTLRDEEGQHVLVHALMKKGDSVYMDTVLSVLKPGTVFLGGPPMDDGVLILALETLV